MTPTTELVATGGAKRTLMINRSLPEPIGQLGSNQLNWCRSKWPWFEMNKVVRLADHERASAAYRIADLVDEARRTMETV